MINKYSRRSLLRAGAGLSAGLFVSWPGPVMAGSGWYIHSFDRARWDAVFGGGLASVKQKIVDLFFYWDDDGYFNHSDGPGPNRKRILESKKGRQVTNLAAHLVKKGFTYNGLDPEQAKLLDEFGFSMWNPEGLAEILDARQHSPDFLAITSVTELLYRSGNVSAPLGFLEEKNLRGRRLARSPARLLPLLLTGRRFGTEDPTQLEDTFYVVFSPAELVELRNEVLQAISAPRPWRYPKEDPALVEQCFVNPLNEVVDSSRWGGNVLRALAGWYSSRREISASSRPGRKRRRERCAAVMRPNASRCPST